MTRENGQIYEFGNFRVDAMQRTLSQNGNLLKLSPKTFDLLLALIENNKRVVSKEELMRQVWADAFVEEANLSVHVSALRKIFGGENGGFIETIPKRGYRFVADVRELAASQTNNAPNRARGKEISPESENDAPVESKQAETTSETPHINGANVVRYRQELSADSPPENAASENTALHPPTAKAARAKKLFVFAALSFLLFAIAAFAFYKFSGARQSFQTMKIERVRETNKTAEAAISPDGKYLAHVVREPGKQSLHVKHIATNSAVQLVAPVAASFSPLTFSKDGSYIYYVLSENDQPGVLFQIPVLGGEPKKILESVAGAISFAPDGERFAFVRRVSPDETALMTADLAGDNVPRQLAIRRKPDNFNPNGAAWSPNGATIAISGGSASGERLSNIFSVTVGTGEMRPISNRKWRAIDRAVWLKDGSALIAPAMDVQGQEAFQIWEFPFRGGEARRITNDLNDYGGISLTADEKTLATIQFEVRRNIWIVPALETKQAKSLTDGIKDSFRFVSWSSDNKIIYPSLLSGTRDIWTMNADGNNRKQLTATEHNDILPVSGDGRFIVFASNRAASGAVNIWRMNSDGSNVVQLTFGADESQPSVSPDGRWVIYAAGGNDAEPEKRSLWKVSIEGGKPVQLTTNPSHGADISPDGKQFVCRYKTNEAWKAAIVPIDGGEPTTFVDVAPGSPLRWSADGAAITYIKTQNGVSNIWSQLLSGEAPKQLTDFTAEQIYFFDWSPENQLVCSRGVTTQEAVLISDFK